MNDKHLHKFINEVLPLTPQDTNMALHKRIIELENQVKELKTLIERIDRFAAEDYLFECGDLDDFVEPSYRAAEYLKECKDE